ncbi:hypothetical protein MAR_006497 [Mya arenaria]|uniref:Low-density lipoprotein receptor domain class A n=1 Tax=Mya arenaria TaxID=6604 RepID=A0ABY7DBN8_MYAAR|nr:hypothetical protein MAR_006497 [Mya arenaria]
MASKKEDSTATLPSSVSTRIVYVTEKRTVLKVKMSLLLPVITVDHIRDDRDNDCCQGEDETPPVCTIDVCLRKDRFFARFPMCTSRGMTEIMTVVKTLTCAFKKTVSSTTFPKFAFTGMTEIMTVVTVKMRLLLPAPWIIAFKRASFFAMFPRCASSGMTEFITIVQMRFLLPASGMNAFKRAAMDEWFKKDRLFCSAFQVCIFRDDGDNECGQGEDETPPACNIDMCLHKDCFFHNVSEVCIYRDDGDNDCGNGEDETPSALKCRSMATHALLLQHTHGAVFKGVVNAIQYLTKENAGSQCASNTPFITTHRHQIVQSGSIKEDALAPVFPLYIFFIIFVIEFVFFKRLIYSHIRCPSRDSI